MCEGFVDKKIKNLHEQIQDIVYKEKEKLPAVEKRAYVLAAYFLLKKIKIEEGEIIVGQRHREYVSTNYPSNIDEEINYLRKKSVLCEWQLDNIIRRKNEAVDTKPGWTCCPGL